MSKPHLFRLLKDREKKIPKYLFEQYPDRVARVIFEGILGSGDVPGNLELMIKDQNETRTVASFKLPMHLKPIKELYEHWTVGDTNAKGTTVLGTAINAESFEYGGAGVAPRGLAIKNDAHEDEYIMFVHGWRMQPWERRRFAETSLKRLYWQGYKGKFGLFSWPGEYVSSALIATEPMNYGNSEAIARRSGKPFAQLTVDLGTKYNVHIFAHSMGNYVVSEALKRETTSITTYVATQAATEAESYAPYLSPDMDVSQPLTAIVSKLNNMPTWAKIFWIVNLVDIAASYNPETFTDAWAYANSGVVPPDLFNQTPPTNTYYFNGIQNKTKFLNFYNAQDEALKAYEANQVTKPDASASISWEYSSTTGDQYWRDTFGPVRDEISWNGGVIDPAITPGAAEILSHIIPARSVALGAYGGAGGEITPAVDLFAPTGLNFNKVHSAQFLDDNAKRQAYWARLIDEMGL